MSTDSGEEGAAVADGQKRESGQRDGATRTQMIIDES